MVVVILKERFDDPDDTETEENAQSNATSDLIGEVSDAFFEGWKFHFIKLIEFSNKHIKRFSLHTNMETYTHCIVDREEGKTCSDGKNATIHTLIESDADDQRSNKGAMCTWEMTWRKKIIPI